MRIAKVLLIVLSVFAGSAMAQWEQTSGPVGGPVSSFAYNSSNGYFFAVAASNTNSIAGVFRSTDLGVSWTPLYAGTPGDFVAYTVAAAGGHTFVAGVYNSTGTPQIYHSINDGTTWTPVVPTGLPGFWAPRNMYMSGSTLIMSTIFTPGVYYSTDNGANWTASTGIPGTADIVLYTERGSYVYAGTSAASSTRGIYRSKNNGQTWTAADLTSFGSGYLTGLSANANGLFATTALSGAYRSTDSGQVWTKINPDSPSNFATTILATATNVYLGVGMAIYKGDADGNGLAVSSTGMPPVDAGNGCYTSAGIGPVAMMAAGKLGVWRSSNSGVSWAETNTGLKACQINGLFGEDSYVFAACEAKGFFRTSDHGSSWLEVDTGITKYHGWFSLIKTNAGSYLGGCGITSIFRSTDAGLHWSPTSGNVTSGTMGFTTGEGDTVYSTGLAQIQMSVDDGQNWTSVPSGFLGYEVGFELIKRGPYMMVSSSLSKKRSIDNGQTWTAPVAGLAGASSVNGWAKFDTILFAAANGGVFKSLDNGANWSSSSTGVTGAVKSIAIVGGTIFVGTSSGFLTTNMVYRSDDTGTTWTAIDQGLLPQQTVNKLVADGQYLYAGTPGRSVWRRLLSQITEVEQIDNPGLPSSFQLAQNYPNPFNPTTSIEFSLATRSHVSLEIFNSLGQRVRVLDDETRAPGTYRVDWNGRNDSGDQLATGIYLYRLTTDAGVITKKMLLVK